MTDHQSSPFMPAAFAVGVALHVCLFRLGEWDLATTKLIIGAFLSCAVSGVALWQLFPADYPSLLVSFTTASQLTGIVILGIVSSMMVYRGAFHRLGHFPGPFLARFSNLYITRLSAKKLHLYEEIQRLHHKYGDYVRIGRSTNSILKQSLTNQVHRKSR